MDLGNTSARGTIAVPRHPRAATALRSIIAEIGQRSGEFPVFLANHLPMVLEAMGRLGAAPEPHGPFVTGVLLGQPVYAGAGFLLVEVEGAGQVRPRDDGRAAGVVLGSSRSERERGWRRN